MKIGMKFTNNLKISIRIIYPRQYPMGKKDDKNDLRFPEKFWDFKWG